MPIRPYELQQREAAEPAPAAAPTRKRTRKRKPVETDNMNVTPLSPSKD